MAKRRAKKPRKESPADAANQEDDQIKEPTIATSTSTCYESKLSKFHIHYAHGDPKCVSQLSGSLGSTRA